MMRMVSVADVFGRARFVVVDSEAIANLFNDGKGSEAKLFNDGKGRNLDTAQSENLPTS